MIFGSGETTYEQENSRKCEPDYLTSQGLEDEIEFSVSGWLKNGEGKVPSDEKGD